MIDYQHYKNVVELISKEVCGELNAEETSKLSSWIKEQPENELLYNQIRNSENFRNRNSNFQDIDVLAGWERLNDKIERSSKIVKIRKVLGWAAAILIPIMVVGGFSIYFQSRELVENKVVQVHEILPGKPRAILVLDDGKSVMLDSLDQLAITEKDGTMIERGAQSLNYSKNSGKSITENIYNTVKIPQGGEYNLVLADGTHVFLNAESQMRYPVHFAGNTREIELSGEAYFEVTKDAKKPFIVKLAGMSVEVLGTSFNLNAYANTGKIFTTLVNGSVKLNIPGSSETKLLKPEEQAAFDVKSGQTEIRKVDVNLYTGWKDGRLNFYDSRLEDIMITLTRWYSADVVYRDSSVKNLRFSGSLDRYGEINQILDIIKSTKKLKIEIEGNTILFGE